jgi:uncharacterized protein (UPF0548 family)
MAPTLAALHGLGLNFEPRPIECYTPERGWHDDALRQELPGEPPGPPVPGGAWETARRLVAGYRMADPRIVRATFDRDAPLEGRDMLLELRFRGILRIHAGVRVTRCWDEEQDEGGRRARVFGYEYATLDGHVEMGRMDYEVRKLLDDGTVEFRLHAHSRASHQGAPWVRLGFRLFGRREQLRFYRACCARIAVLTARELGLPERPPPPAARIRDGDAPEAAELAERLVPRRTKDPAAEPRGR